MLRESLGVVLATPGNPVAGPRGCQRWINFPVDIHIDAMRRPGKRSAADLSELILHESLKSGQRSGKVNSSGCQIRQFNETIEAT
jgi:hypothetical protein